MRWKKVALIGVGLLGGSLGLALKRRRLARRIVGYVRRASSVKECEECGAVHEATRDLAAAVKDADLVVLCTPVAQMGALVREMGGSLKRGCLVTDVGSVKVGVIRDVERVLARAGAQFVGSHPMAGAEKTGVLAARPELFDNAVCVVTPSAKTSRKALRQIEWFWRSIGCRVLTMTAEQHDQLVSRSSHLPHVVAAALANLVLRPNYPKQQAMLCANGFRDTTRIASGSIEMWRDIALSNGKNIGVALESFMAELRGFQNLLKAEDAAGITRFFDSAKRRRDQWTARAASTSPE